MVAMSSANAVLGKETRDFDSKDYRTVADHDDKIKAVATTAILRVLTALERNMIKVREKVDPIVRIKEINEIRELF